MVAAQSGSLQIAGSTAARIAWHSGASRNQKEKLYGAQPPSAATEESLKQTTFQPCKKGLPSAALFGQFTDSYFALVSVFASLKTLRTSARNGLASEGAGTEPESVFRQLTLLP